MKNENIARRLLFTLPIGWLVVFVGCSHTIPQPPIAQVHPRLRTIHGHEEIDNYFWLRQRDNQEVIRYLENENTYTQAMMRHTEALQEKLYGEMKGRMKPSDESVPARKGDYYYYTRAVEGKQYRVHCRKYRSLDAEEEILLDQNLLADGKEYFRLGVASVSPDHRLLAYSVDTSGGEVYTLFIKDLTTGGLLLDEIPNTYYSMAWSNDNRTLFYNTLDKAKRPFKVFRHLLGTQTAQDELVHHERDERFFVSLSKTRSDQYILINLQSKLTSEVRFLDADTPGSNFRVIQQRQEGLEYSVTHHADHFYIVTNDNAINFKVVRAPVASPQKGNWETFVPHRPSVKIDSVAAFRNYLAISQRDRGLRTLRIFDMNGAGHHEVDFPESVYTFRTSGNREYDTDTLRFSYTSLVTPNSVFDYDMGTRKRVLKKQDEVVGGYDPSKYVSERILARASDGVEIPISLVYAKGFKPNGRSALLLDGYGSYGASRDPRFSSARLSLLQRGVVYAIAHVRGGGDMGRPWYEDGKLLNKRNTFTDFIACAELLIEKGYTSSDRLVITGGSAGGLLMGAVTNMRPNLFKAVVARVPFVDVVNTMLDPSIPLTVTEYEEWGNPNDPRYYDYMMSYSPYDNVTVKAYPNILITAGLNDPRVQYWEPAKWTAKLRALKTDGRVLLLKTNMGAGHGGASGRYNRLRDMAFQYAFMLDMMGIRG